MRFYVSPDSIFPKKNIIEIKDRDELHHIRDVMRLKEGSRVSIFDGEGNEYAADIKKILKNSVQLDIKGIIVLKQNPSIKITLYQSLPKNVKMDFIIRKAVELGVDEIVPIITDRTVPDVKEIRGKKMERWERIAKAASKQCGRIKLPVISNAVGFKEALVESKKAEKVVFAALSDDAVPLKEMLRGKMPESAAVFIGPEGDFTRDEINMAKEEGYRVCSLGNLVLRVETAALYVLSCINYEYAD
jgi:16S rRNA (uracil1498-N3)-methyltransferase